MTIYVHLTPAEAIALATHLTASAQRVNTSKERYKNPLAYEYTTVGYAAVEGTKDAGDKIRVRIGDETL